MKGTDGAQEMVLVAVLVRAPAFVERVMTKPGWSCSALSSSISKAGTARTAGCYYYVVPKPTLWLFGLC